MSARQRDNRRRVAAWQRYWAYGKPTSPAWPTTPSGRSGYDILHVSSGAAGGLLKLNRDGTYSWNSYGGKSGKWVETGRAGEPIEIIDTVENRRWGVRLEPKTGESSFSPAASTTSAAAPR
jgi:hypothetical protein